MTDITEFSKRDSLIIQRAINIDYATIFTELWEENERLKQQLADAKMGSLSLTPIEFQAIQDALLFTQINSGIVSDAHISVLPKIAKRIEKLAEATNTKESSDD